jgi:hypothetical protein
MTLLEEMVQQHVTAGVAHTVRRAVDRVAENLTDDIFSDPQFQDRLRTLVRHAFERTLRDLALEK